ncbi:MAG: hypothetical protein ABEK01_02770 [Candidatus Nanohaloarchaea archaeon]
MKYGWSNEIEEMEDRFRKKYREFPSGAFTRSLYDAVRGEGLDYPSAEDRMENELEGIGKLEDIGIDVPEVLGTGEEDGRPFIDMGKVSGDNLMEIVAEEGLEEVYSQAREFGRELRAVHESGSAIYDPAIHNVKVDDGLTFLDLEYFVGDADSHHFTRDVEQAFLYPSMMEEERYSAFRDGFTQGYGGAEVLEGRIGLKGAVVRLRRADLEGSRNSLLNSLLLSEQPLKNSEFLSSV